MVKVKVRVKEVIHTVQVNPTTVINSWTEATTDVHVQKVLVQMSPFRHDIFKLLASLIDLIVEQTILYASQASQYEQWSKVTADEIWAYFGFMISMGINQLPAIADYWKLDPTYRYGPIAGRITRD